MIIFIIIIIIIVVRNMYFIPRVQYASDNSTYLVVQQTSKIFMMQNLIQFFNGRFPFVQIVVPNSYHFYGCFYTSLLFSIQNLANCSYLVYS